jgi:GT2 family glycosyltransferase
LNNTKPLISIITVNYNGLDMTLDLLKSIDKQSYKNVEIFVVDNASREDPAMFFQKNHPEIKFIRSEKNLGFAGGNNLAVKQAKGDFLFFINNDAEITEGVLQKLVALFTEKPKLGIVSPLLLYFNESKGSDKDLIQYAGTTRVDSVTARNRTLGEKEWDNGQFNTATETAYAHGAAMMIKWVLCLKIFSYIMKNWIGVSASVRQDMRFMLSLVRGCITKNRLRFKKFRA